MKTCVSLIKAVTSNKDLSTALKSITIPSHPYILMKRNILCNCDVEAKSNFLLESLAACEGSETKTDLENVLYNKLGFHKLLQ